MKLLTLQLENFQGIRAATFDFGGRSANIYGDNATGKTTVFNAITWILFDKASTGAKNFTPKTAGPDGELHNLEHSAEASFETEDGAHITLRKTYHEIYKKKRGSVIAEFDGHTVDYFINGVPAKEKEFTAQILGMGNDINKMKMLTMPTYFPEDMSWSERRALLLEVCGDVDDATVIASTPELTDLPAFLRMPGNSGTLYGVDEYRKIATARKADINKELESIPARVDEARRAIPDINGISESAENAAIADLKNEESRLMRERIDISSGTAEADAIKQARSDIRTRTAEARARHAEESEKLNDDVRREISSLRGELLDAKDAASKADREAEDAGAKDKRLTALRTSLLEEYATVQGETWSEENGICPTCHQPLPAADIDRMHEEYNLRRSKRLEDINARGRTEASKGMIAEARIQAESCRAQAESHRARITDLTAQIERAQGRVIAPTPFESTEQYKSIADELRALDERETNAAADISGRTRPIDERIAQIKTDISTHERNILTIHMAAAQEKRIKELELRESELAAQYEETERGVYLCELFIKSKVSMLTDRINGKFRSVRFRLFQEQINGGLKEDCEVMVPSDDGSMVPFTYANNAARINAGLEIINALSHHWGFSMPVCIDNAESVTHLQEVDAQVIRLVVSEMDKKLRMEVA